MKNNTNQKQNELTALRFKEIRIKKFHSKISHDGKRKDNTQEDFAEYLGVTPQTIRNYENSKTPIPYKHLNKLANEFDINIKYLLGEDDYPTIKEKRAAIAKKSWEKSIAIPMEIDNLVSDILEKMGYTEFEDDITRQTFFTAEFEVPADYTIDQSIPQKALTESFNNTACHIRPQEYHGIRREKDGKSIYIYSSRLNAIFDDIENYIKYRIEKEFR